VKSESESETNRRGADVGSNVESQKLKTDLISERQLNPLKISTLKSYKYLDAHLQDLYDSPTAG
jgi:hypothetical protein